MRVLVVGAGGREHALVWKLRQGRTPVQVYAAPGNPGIALLARCLPIDFTDIAGLLHAAEELEIDLTVVGPEAPLAAGIVDVFRAQGLRIFGPTQAAAQIESSKVFAKQLMARSGIPTAPFEVFTDPAKAVAYVRTLNFPQVVKADGLAAGKGVMVCEDAPQAERAIFDLMVAKKFGEAGSRIIIEERLNGDEASILALVGPGGVIPLLPAQDYKRAYDGDRGPNTGGLGAIVPGTVSPSVAADVVEAIIEPTVWAMEREDRIYTGVLYAGVMVTDDGPKVLEFNCRFGDPETQVILPLLESDLTEAMINLLDVKTPSLRWKDGAAACVVLASRGYPGSPERGQPIFGLEDPGGVLVFHAGTAASHGRIVTAGGRVLNVVATGDTLEEAVERAYSGVARIQFEGMHFRRDIGQRKVAVSEEVPV